MAFHLRVLVYVGIVQDVLLCIFCVHLFAFGVRNLDLVNGKLDDEIAKLKTISQQEAQRQLSTYEVAARDAGKVNLKAGQGKGKYEIHGDFSGLDYKDANAISDMFTFYYNKHLPYDKVLLFSTSYIIIDYILY